MELEINYELSDWLEFHKFLERRICRDSRAWWDSLWVSFLVWFLVAFSFFTFFQSNAEFSWPTAFIVALVSLYFVTQLVLGAIKVKRACQPMASGTFLGHHKFIVGEGGIKSTGADYEATHNWSAVQRVENTDKAIYVFIDSSSAFIFPRSKVENPEELLAVINKNVTKQISRTV